MDPLFENYLISRGIRPEEFTQSPLDKNKSELVEAYEKQIEGIHLVIRNQNRKADLTTHNVFKSC